VSIKMSGHIPIPELALFSRGDLSFWMRWRVERHLRHCEECAQLTEEFVRMQDQLAQTAEDLPASFSDAAWRSIAAEMTANIHLGLAAGECVSVRPRLLARPRMAFALAGLAILVIFAGVESSVPHKTSPVQSAEEAGLSTLEASATGIAVHSAGHMLSVSAPPGVEARDLIQTVNTRGDMHSRYTDDTGVTINAVYADAE
jgi:anti-sigma factor RsiW